MKDKKQEMEENLSQEEEEIKEKYIRLYSEYENYRKRTSKEKLDLIQTAGERVIKELLPVIDDFDRASNDKNAEIPEGIQLIFQKMLHALKAVGLKEVDAKEQDFNPDYHDCITQFDAPSEELEGKVMDVVEKGYTLNDKVIRYAKVVVGK